ncbi:type IV toxin-antitoxin system AbiEi family antitoxin domain-containing protein [Arthrobacter sp. I2-34]|uniref:Type IV toxin-antitoxin system AbiEi family antitoxin domain-containing protein n=1 Tax=Arthrobacter hankyongi TaxID=2904801 RepID=A0ABS9L173_9MICC|nr:type IV toxin-antitoxin system AbiEi family antitoxin domain-containing protein [Arthrobacter hankyongi]MCG2620442.1 type IV toxin-antitoxin system AbiEi family antitoxin domain-containing protein [Arthrobacter hankyongi]
MMNQLIFTRDEEQAGRGPRGLAHRCSAGELTRLRQGVYVPTEIWSALPPGNSTRLRIEAAVGKGRTPCVLTQESAAAVWGIPISGNTSEVQLLATNGAHGKRRAHLRWHARTLPEPVQDIDGLLVTGRIQTVVDMAARLRFEQAVPGMDHILRSDGKRRLPALDKDQLRAVAGQLPPMHNAGGP